MRVTAEIPGDVFANLPDVSTSPDTEAWMIGPMTRKQVIELYFRVKSIRFYGSYDWIIRRADPTPDETGTATYDVTLTRGYGEAHDEADVMAQFLNDGGSNILSWTTIGSITSEMHLAASTAINVGDSADADLYLGDPGEYWMRVTGALTAGFGISIQDSLGSYAVRDSAKTDSRALSGGLDFSSGGTVQLPVGVMLTWDDTTTEDVRMLTSTSGQVEIAEWFPYADRAGLDAWDTTTGLEDNGGPGG